MLSHQCQLRGACLLQGTCACAEGFGGPRSHALLSEEGEPLRQRPEKDCVRVHFVWGVTQAPPARAFLTGQPKGAALDLSVRPLLSTSAQTLIADFCESLESAPHGASDPAPSAALSSH